MKKNNKIIGILAVLFVVVIVGASILYNQLSSKMKSNNLMQEATGEAELKEDSAAAENDSADTENSSAEDEASQNSEQSQVPDFTVTDSDGNEVKLSDFFGKPIVLNFWASWCGPCKSEMPDFDEAYKELGEDIEFLMVNMTDGSRETVEKAKAHVEEQGYSFPVYFDTATDAAITYQVMSIPTTYFIDENGYGIAQAAGAIDRETLQKGIDMIFPTE